MTTAAIPFTAPMSSSRALRVGLWVTQGLLAAMFLMSGLMKLTTPVAELAAAMPWVSGSLGGLVRLIGAAELAGAIGLILPAATRIQPRLTVLAALGLMLIMAGAAVTHVARGELGVVAMPVILGGLAAFVAWGRSKKAPIAPR